MPKDNLPSIKNNLKDFLQSEEGKISKKNILNLGIGVAAVGLLLAESAQAQHTSYFKNPSGGGQHLSGPPGSVPPPPSDAHHTSEFRNVAGKGQHSSHSSHSSHASHASHAQHSSHASHASHAQHSSHASHASHAQHSSHASHASHAQHSSHASHASHAQHSSHASHASHAQHSSHASHASHAQHSSHASHASHAQHSSHASHASHAQHSSHASHAQHSSHASHSSCGGGGGCPFIVLWNGSEYVLENNILPQSENLERDNLVAEDLYKLEYNPQPEDGQYKIRLVEFEQERSFFEDVELIKIQHPEDVNVGVLDGEIIYCKDILEPSRIVRKGEDIGREFKGKKGDSIEMRYDSPPQGRNIWVFRTSLRNGDRRLQGVDEILENKINTNEVSSIKTERLKKVFVTAALSALGSLYPVAAAALCKPMKFCAIGSIHSYLKKGEEKLEIDVNHPREKKSTGLVNLDLDELDLGGGFGVEMQWTDTHNVEILGLARSLSADDIELNKTSLKLESLVSSNEESNYDPDKLEEDGFRLEPGDAVTLNFKAPQNGSASELDTSFILRTKGYYRSIRS